MASMTALDRAKETSTVVEATTLAVERSRLVERVTNRWCGVRDAAAATKRSVRRWWRTSRVKRMVEATDEAFDRGARGSTLLPRGTVIRRWVRASFLHRWLTGEREPGVVTVDLRNTKTVGPLLAVLDRIHGTVVTYRGTSLAHRAVVDVGEHARQTPVRAGSIGVLVAVAAAFPLLVVFEPLGGVGPVAAGVLAALSVPGLRSDASWSDLRERRLLGTLLAALTPPGPPDGRGDGEFDREDRDRR